MRLSGTLTRWDDTRGFGFVEADQGGEPLFVHIRAFGPMGAMRPTIGLRLNFEVEPSPKGGKRATRIQIERFRPELEAARAARARIERRRAQPAQWGTASLLVLPLFLVGYALASWFWHVPGWVAAVYAGASLASLIAYANDKAAARAGRWRTSEQTLHMLALMGGWPGALVAQQWLRHKSNKASFRSTFWASVVANVAGFVLLFSPLVKRFTA